MLRLGARRVVAEGGDAPGDVGPDGAQGKKVFIEEGLAGAIYAEPVVRG